MSASTSIAAAFGQQAAAEDKIIGSWKLLSFFDQNVDTGKTTDVSAKILAAA
jgi:hypothetical protein